ncbi:hypothetical protein U9M48_027334, partial [Paspalum notatum var. saurae]
MRASPGGLLLQSSFFAADGSAISSLSFLALYIVVVLSGGRCLQRSSSNPLQSRLPLRFAGVVNMSDDMSSLGQEPSMLCEKFALLWFNTAMQPRKKVNLVEVYVMVYVALLLILLVLGHYRRRSRNLVVQYGFKGAYLLSWVLVSKTLGRMLGVIKNELYPVWATFMVLVFAGANSVLVQNLDENKQWLKFMFDSALYLNYFNAIVENLATIPGTKVYIPVIVLFFVGVLFCIKYRERQHALALASEARGNGSRTVARHMKHETVLSRRYDPHTMQGYNYLVLPFINLNLPIRLLPGQVYAKPVRDRLVTLEKIWCHDSGVLSSDDDPAIRHLKDMCLSFALFRLAVRRYFGYACAESGLSKTRDLVLQGLLPRAEEDWERAFQVIEVELAFLYDFFFAMYARIMCQLVPGNSLDTEYMLDELVWEARKAFPANSDIYKRLGELHREGTKDGMLAKGTEFGMKLESMENQWKVLADFWAELLLYIAPSDNVANHIEHLAKGGEFVTHVWALLMHAGILERPAASAAE